ncbi:MAG: hypothetical protein GWO16_13460 [Gammaproteobacteria bacterium]|nr:hypothetical protein [Gammaproteobacteria bacterium]NIR31776.1 hypothetical protein [Gammaproteobacteria bacterium]NIR98707.1 hypothetical protein [Gammaproteobacteria bacterium]NIT64424.1 hypothetical protein [Gammaproteobacteria bacterium]NIV20839.1 hypothetical protein [Gammaproteobacteria bacterium]
MMVRPKHECLGHYDFDHIAAFAQKRFVEGYDTIALLQQARSEREREEIALVCMLDIEDDVVKDIQLRCRYADECKITDCRERLRRMIDRALAAQKS